jgi:hypothetical protein
MKRWQKKLRLQDWKIKIKLVSKVEMIAKEMEYDQDPDTCIGFCEPLAEQKVANIYVLRPRENGEVHEGVNPSIDATLVHEMLHCHFAPFSTPETKLAVEQAIEAITEALLANE